MPLPLIEKKRSPLKGKPLRNPAQFLDEQINDFVEEKIGGPLWLALIFIIATGLEWYRYFYPPKSAPIIFSLVTLLMVGYAAVCSYRARSHLKRLKLGRDGEKSLGQFLESLREQEYKVFHDIPGDNFNIDHVLIGPAGIFTVETKTRSKSNGNSRIIFDGESIRVDGHAPDPAPIIQAKAQANWLRELLAQITGRNFAVKPVIVYPGWYIEDRSPKEKAVRVLEPKALAKILNHAPITLAREDAHLSAFHLSRFVRNASSQQ
jgi:hypothetical protein